MPFAPIRERVSQMFQRLLLPQCYLRRMHPVMGADLVRCAYSLDRFQRHFALERSLVLLPLFAHQSLPLRHRFYILFTCPVFGEYYRAPYSWSCTSLRTSLGSDDISNACYASKQKS